VTSSEFCRPACTSESRTFSGDSWVDYYGQGERVCFAYSVANRRVSIHAGIRYVEFLPIRMRRRLRSAGPRFTTRHRSCCGTEPESIVNISTSTMIGSVDVSLGKRTFDGIIGRSNEVLFGRAGEVLIGLNHIPRGCRFPRPLPVRSDSTRPCPHSRPRSRWRQWRNQKPDSCGRTEKDSNGDSHRRGIHGGTAATRAGKIPFVVHLFEAGDQEGCLRGAAANAPLKPAGLNSGRAP